MMLYNFKNTAQSKRYILLDNGKKHPYLRAISNLKQMPKIKELGKSLLKITMF